MDTMAKNVIAMATKDSPEIKRPHELKDLTPEENLRKSYDIEATNIILLSLPLDIYTLVNHHKIDKDIWDRVKELIEGNELTKQERESKLYDDFDRFTSEKEESIHSYYLRFAKFATAAKQAKDLHRVNFDQLLYAKQCTTKKRVKDAKWFKEKMLLAQAHEAKVILQEEQQDFLADGLEEFDSNCDDLPLNTTSIFKADHVDAFDSDCDEAPTASAIFIARLSPAGSVNGDDVSPTYDSDILSEVPNYDTHHETDMLNPFVQEMEYSEH
ncbi:hypothetical protein Tco_0921049 [Tanacetum coccineum]